MKRLFATLALVAFLGAGVGTVRANEGPMTAQEKQKHLNDKVEKMTKKLNLTADQQSTVRAAMESKMDKIEEIKLEADQKIRSTLNPEQAKKFDEWKKDKMND